jgi:nitrogen fixation protein NifU and related proteins
VGAPRRMVGVEDFYRENILDHYKHPRNTGHLDAPTVSAEGMNPLCGDELEVELLVEDGLVADVRMNGRGCAISQAAASMLSESLKGRPVGEASQLGKDEVLEELGIPLTPVRLKCALLSVGVVKVALGRLTGDELPAEWSADDDFTWKSA